MQNAPLDFVMHASDAEIANLQKFVYRTFNGHDLVDFVLVLRRIYTTHGGLEAAFSTGTDTCERLAAFRILFATYAVQPHTLKHIADITTGSAAKRLNMYLRWMVRSDNRGVDFGLWKQISPAELLIPLDLHSAGTARKLGLLSRKANDFKAVTELMKTLREFDAGDPVKSYNFV